MTNRRWLFLGLGGLLVVALAFLAYSSLDRPTRIDYYRVADEHTLLAGTVSGPGANVRVTNVAETPETVTITVSSFYFQLGPSTSEGYGYESEANSRTPWVGAPSSTAAAGYLSAAPTVRRRLYSRRSVLSLQHAKRSTPANRR